MALIDFYVDPVNGSNLNSGSTNVAAPFYVSASGNWNQSTHIFTPTDGQNPVVKGVAVGDYISLCLNSATETVWISRCAGVVNATNGAITLSGLGAGASEPGTSSGNMTVRDGGQWKGPASTSFPFSLARLGQLTPAGGAVSNDTTRINFRNNAVYAISVGAGIGVGSPQNLPLICEAYNNTPGDFQDTDTPVVWSGGTAVPTVFTISVGTWTYQIRHFHFVNSFTTGTADLVSDSSSASLWWDCTFEGARGSGINTSGTCVECEAFNCNKSNTVLKGGFSVLAGSNPCIRCSSHDNVGSNNCGFAAFVSLIGCIANGNGGHGVGFGSPAASLRFINCDFYNNSGAGIGLVSGASESGKTIWAESCNFLKNSGGALNINNTTTSGNWPQGQMINCGFGSGAMANGNNILGGVRIINPTFYPIDVQPWKDPDHGDFTLILSNGLNAGRGLFHRAGTIVVVGTGYWKAVTRYVQNGGTGYQVGDVLTAVGGTFSAPAKLHVDKIGTGGSIQFNDGGSTWFYYDHGVYTVIPTNTVSFSGGHGSGAMVDLTWTYVSVEEQINQSNIYYGYPDIGAVQALILGSSGGKPPAPAPAPPTPPGAGEGVALGDKAALDAKAMAELADRARKAIDTVNNIRIVGEGWSGNAKDGFMFNP